MTTTSPHIPLPTLAHLRDLQERIGTANAAKGFHRRSHELLTIASGTTRYEGRADSPVDEALRENAIATLALIITEASEAIEEVRAGHGLDETYYTHPDDDTIVLVWDDNEGGVWREPNGLAHPSVRHAKPEGVLAELADIVIRAFDFAARFKLDLPAAIDEKLFFNATRPFMHGGKKL